jgi:hypothetical protein
MVLSFKLYPHCKNVTITWYKIMRFIVILFITTIIQVTAFAQDPMLNQVQQQLDRQKEIKKNLIYSFTTLSYIHKLDKQGLVEKTDTVETWQKFLGDSLLDRQIVYTSDKKQKKREDGRGHSQSMELPKLNDPRYEFLVDRSGASISFKPKKPKGGDLAGAISYDPQDLSLEKMDITMPKLSWPVNEFSMKAEFIMVEEVLFPSKLWMQAGWDALISKGRIRVESSNSDYKIYK